MMHSDDDLPLDHHWWCHDWESSERPRVLITMDDILSLGYGILVIWIENLMVWVVYSLVVNMNLLCWLSKLISVGYICRVLNDDLLLRWWK